MKKFLGFVFWILVFFLVINYRNEIVNFVMKNFAPDTVVYNAFYNESPTKATMIKDCKEPCYFGCGTGVDFDERLI